MEAARGRARAAGHRPSSAPHPPRHPELLQHLRPRHHPPPRPTSIFLCPVAPAALAVRLWGPPEGKGRKRGGEAARAAGEASIFRFISLISL
jgi:hypothetical protein